MCFSVIHAILHKPINKPFVMLCSLFLLSYMRVRPFENKFSRRPFWRTATKSFKAAPAQLPQPCAHRVYSHNSLHLPHRRPQPSHV